VGTGREGVEARERKAGRGWRRDAARFSFSRREVEVSRMCESSKCLSTISLSVIPKTGTAAGRYPQTPPPGTHVRAAHRCVSYMGWVGGQVGGWHAFFVLVGTNNRREREHTFEGSQASCRPAAHLPFPHYSTSVPSSTPSTHAHTRYVLPRPLLPVSCASPMPACMPAPGPPPTPPSPRAKENSTRGAPRRRPMVEGKKSSHAPLRATFWELRPTRDQVHADLGHAGAERVDVRAHTPSACPGSDGGTLRRRRERAPHAPPTRPAPHTPAHTLHQPRTHSRHWRRPRFPS